MPTPNEISERFGRVLSSICCVQTGGNPLGTGFLVGPDTVLTNYHVVERIMDAAGQFVQPVTCVFDYLRLPDSAVQFGTSFKVVGWLDRSPYGPAESGDRINDPMPTPDELDYALLRLDQRVGEMQPPGRVLKRRGWIDMWDTPWDTNPPPEEGALVITAHDRVIVIQHPLGGPQVYAAKTFLGDNLLHTRMRYEFMARPGSSGSPCLTEEYKLFALHHLGDPNWNAVAFSQGVPINLIRQRICRPDPDRIRRDWIPKFDVLADARQQAPWSGLFRVLDQYPQAKTALRESRETIRTITDRTADLRRHKAIHDVLGILQGNFPQLKVAFNQPDPKKCRDGVRMAALIMWQSWRSFETEASELKEAGRARGLREMEWIDEFSGALTTLVEADQIFDKLAAASTIQKHLRFQPSELNGKIRQILSSLPVDELLDVFQDVIRAMDLADKAFETIVRSGPDLLRAHWERLRQNVADHNAWQDIDNDLSMLESLPAGWEHDPRWFQAGWDRVLPKVTTLCMAHAAEKWVTDMQRHAGIVVDDIKTGKWDNVAEHFAVFRSDMSNRFSQVDKSLLSGSEQIIQLGNPLAALVEASL